MALMASMASIGKYYHKNDLKDLPWIEVIELAKHSMCNIVWIGNYYCKKGEYNKAIFWFEKILENKYNINDGSTYLIRIPKALSVLINLYTLKIKNYEKLYKYSSHLLEFEGNDPVALKGFAISLQSKDFENTKYFLKYMNILPNDIINIISLYFKPSSVLF